MVMPPLSQNTDDSRTPEQAKQRILRGMRDLPALPQVVNEVVSLLNTPQSSSSQIASLISYDPGLTSRILRMVNSSAYGIPRQVTSIQHSITMLGYNAVKGLVLGASICQIFSIQNQDTKNVARAYGDKLDIQEFWQHALMVAFFAKLIADLYRLPNADDIFSAGMLHNVGILVLHVQDANIDKALHLQLKQKKVWRYSSQAIRLESAVLGFTHVELGKALAERWQLPDSMQAVIGRYFFPIEEGSPNDAAVFAVGLAHQLLSATHTHHSHILDVSCDDLSPELADYFSLETDEAVQELCGHIPFLIEESREIMASLLN